MLQLYRHPSRTARQHDFAAADMLQQRQRIQKTRMQTNISTDCLQPGPDSRLDLPAVASFPDKGK